MMRATYTEMRGNPWGSTLIYWRVCNDLPTWVPWEAFWQSFHTSQRIPAPHVTMIGDLIRNFQRGQLKQWRRHNMEKLYSWDVTGCAPSGLARMPWKRLTWRRALIPSNWFDSSRLRLWFPLVGKIEIWPKRILLPMARASPLFSFLIAPRASMILHPCRHPGVVW